MNKQFNLKKIKNTLMVIFIIGNFNLLIAQNNSKSLYSKKLFIKETNYDIFGIPSPTEFNVTILANSSSDFYITIVDEGYSDYEVRKKIKLDQFQFKILIDALETYIKWHKIVTEKEVEVTKSIDSISIKNENVLYYNNTDISYEPQKKELQYNKMVFEFNNNALKINIIGTYLYFDQKLQKQITKIEKIFSFWIHNEDVSTVFSTLTGTNFKITLKEIDEKIGVLNELTR